MEGQALHMKNRQKTKRKKCEVEAREFFNPTRDVPLWDWLEQ